MGADASDPRTEYNESARQNQQGTAGLPASFSYPFPRDILGHAGVDCRR